MRGRKAKFKQIAFESLGSRLRIPGPKANGAEPREPIEVNHRPGALLTAGRSREAARVRSR